MEFKADRTMRMPVGSTIEGHIVPPVAQMKGEHP